MGTVHLMRWLVCVFALASVSLAATSSSSFTVAEVKPHYGCQSPDGQQRVRQYISKLTAANTGIISVLEMGFPLTQPQGYQAFGAACGKHQDPAVVLFNEAQFSLVSSIGATTAGNYSAIPYLGGGQAAGARTNSMCVSDPTAVFGPGGNIPVGSRPYAGAVLKHTDSGRELCVLTGTLAHCSYNWTKQFVADVEQGCGDRQLLVVADTNAGCAVPSLKSDSHWSMNQILAKHGQLSWGPCHDPGLYSQPTCCNDFPDFPYGYDRGIGMTGPSFAGEAVWLTSRLSRVLFAETHLPSICLLKPQSSSVTRMTRAAHIAWTIPNVRRWELCRMRA